MLAAKRQRTAKAKKEPETTVYESVAEVKDEPVVEPVKETVKETVKEKKIRVPRKKKEPVVLSSDDSPDEAPTEKTEKPVKNNKWISCVKQYRTDHPDVSYKDALKMAKEVYVK
jgi:hypothetical protein